MLYTTETVNVSCRSHTMRSAHHVIISREAAGPAAHTAIMGFASSVRLLARMRSDWRRLSASSTLRSSPPAAVREIARGRAEAARVGRRIDADERRRD